MAIIDEFVSGAQKAGKFIAGKAESAVDIVTLEYKASSLRGRIDARYKELGQLYFRLSETQSEDSGELDNVMSSIREMARQLADLDDQIAKYKNICPVCRAANPAKADFCMKCGAKLK